MASAWLAARGPCLQQRVTQIVANVVSLTDVLAWLIFQHPRVQISSLFWGLFQYLCSISELFRAWFFNLQKHDFSGPVRTLFITAVKHKPTDKHVLHHEWWWCGLFSNYFEQSCMHFLLPILQHPRTYDNVNADYGIINFSKCISIKTIMERCTYFPNMYPTCSEWQ